MFPLLLIGLGLGAYFLFFGDSEIRVGDTAKVNGIELVFRQVGAGMAWAPVNAVNASKFTDGMIVSLRGKSWQWFSGLGGFVQV